MNDFDQAARYAAKQFALRMDASVFTLRDMDASALLDRIEAGEVSWAVLAWMSLMRGTDTKEFIDRWKQVADAKGDPAKLVNLAGLVRVFAELTNCQGLWTNELKGWHVMQSQLVESWRTEGELKGMRRLIEQLIRKRFGSPLPPEIVQMLSGQDQVDVLSRWHEEAADATSLDDLRQRMDAE